MHEKPELSYQIIRDLNQKENKMANEQLTEFQNVSYTSRADLEKIANMILRSAGLDTTGRTIGAIPSKQKRFENSMQLGAYSTNGARK